MKHLLLRTTKRVALIAAVFGVISLYSCKDEPTEPTETPVEDGYYIQGGASAYSDFDVKATLKSTKNEVGQADRAELMEIYVALKAGAEGFNIVHVEGSHRHTWGPSADFADVTQGTNDEPQVTFQRGGIEETATAFTVPADGLYHVVIDTEVGKAVIVPVDFWGIIGGATPGGWSSDTKLDASAFDQSSMTFSASDVALTLGDYKFRYSSGWKVEIDTTYDNGAGNDKGIKVNTNRGGTIDMLEAGGDNITLGESGFYDITVTWTAGEDITATLTRTGDLPTKDWTDIELGLVGSGIYNGANEHDWNSTIMLSKPAVNGTVFTWTYADVKITTDPVDHSKSFKIREGQTWDNTIIGYNDVTVDGDGAGEFQGTTPDGNFEGTVQDAVYDMTLTIDASTESQTLTTTKK